ncbi:PucR family transcriptional regulator [endosymbiont 'TC1' of Trimyema compressum]|uniref:PucR family transcriptional regulator n=1 Tax=endosymbiont 'TC1' of Trimyema compressum TaxID=243899 RepID=UPI00139241EC|nr:helix-turn-helix domain-containing protein [endosymbiont 'TC1' of Trimyema compressum]
MKAIIRFSELGFFKLVKIGLDNSVEINRELFNYYIRYLKSLKEYNNEETFDVLVETLEKLIANNFNYSETAENLFIHGNTARYRVALVEKFCKINFKNSEDQFNMMIALKLLPLFKKVESLT